MSFRHSTRSHGAASAPSSPLYSPAPRRSAWRVLILLVALALVGAGLWLGRWQLSRAAQKEAIQAQTEAQGQLPALTQQEFLAMADPLTVQHRRVHLRGLWLGTQTVYLDNRQMHGVPGFYVLTPLALEGTDQTVMVQRGWIQRNFEDRAKLQPVQTPPGLIEIDAAIATPPAHLLELGKPAASEAGQAAAPAATPATAPATAAAQADAGTTTQVSTEPAAQTLSDTPVAPHLNSLPAQPAPAPDVPATSEATTKVPSQALQDKAQQDSAAPPKPLQAPVAARAPAGTSIRQNLDLAAFRTESGLPLRTELSMQQVGAASEGLQRDWPQPALGIERHYGYAFQWFSLSAVVAILYVWFQLIAPFLRRRRASRFHG